MCAWQPSCLGRLRVPVGSRAARRAGNRTPGVNMSGDVNFSALTYDDKTDPVEWLVEHGWAVDPVRSTLELQVGYGLTPPDVDVKIDSFMRSQYITAVRA